VQLGSSWSTGSKLSTRKDSSTGTSSRASHFPSLLLFLALASETDALSSAGDRENILFGLAIGDKGKLFLVDFGLAQPFKTGGGFHIDQTRDGRLVGTRELNQLCCDPSRSDQPDAIGILALASTEMYMSRSASKGLQSSRREYVRCELFTLKDND
jgi:hypothetical protein